MSKGRSSFVLESMRFLQRLRCVVGWAWKEAVPANLQLWDDSLAYNLDFSKLWESDGGRNEIESRSLVSHFVIGFVKLWLIFFSPRGSCFMVGTTSLPLDLTFSFSPRHFAYFWITLLCSHLEVHSSIFKLLQSWDQVLRREQSSLLQHDASRKSIYKSFASGINDFNPNMSNLTQSYTDAQLVDRARHRFAGPLVISAASFMLFGYNISQLLRYCSIFWRRDRVWTRVWVVLVSIINAVSLECWTLLEDEVQNGDVGS